MLALVLSDLRDHKGTWIGALLIAVTAGFIMHYSTILADNTEIGGVMVGRLAAGLGFFCLITSAAMLTGIARLIVARQYKSYALWQLVGIHPRSVKYVVLLQMALLGLLGASIGSLLAIVFFAPTLPVLFPGLIQMFNNQPARITINILPSCLYVVVAYVIGAYGPAKRASQTAPISALSDLEKPGEKLPIARMCLAIAAIGVAIALIVTMRGSDKSLVSNAIFFFNLDVIVLLIIAAPWLLSWVMKLWTLALKAFPLGGLASSESLYALTSSTSIELPIMVSFAMLSGIQSVLALTARWFAAQGTPLGTSINQEAQVMMFWCPICICLVGVMASALVSAAEHSDHAARLTLVGVTKPELITVAAAEAAIHVFNALVTGLAAILFTNIVASLVLGVTPLQDLSLWSMPVVGVVGFLFVFAVLYTSYWRGIQAANPQELNAYE